ncbi:hypothetical protein NDN08_000038 [Rhodosorus marinus]|uniref:Glutaredoxin domain-containing protein n=1 Tax=Rhodosorus marinus TaxID=101924 RepID=A0AAV8UHE8_9RHOD|nr:hypothetical protein NDN08_000038 [Rhodosorus marinus]
MGGLWSRDLEEEKLFEDHVQDLVKESPVVIFSKTYCGYCASAKSDIKAVGKQVENFPGVNTFELDQISGGSKLQAALSRMTGRYTVPNVFVLGESIGGGDEVSMLRHSGGLKKLLEAASKA